MRQGRSPEVTTMPSSLLFWDVDTQFDFMHPVGKLYVPGAKSDAQTTAHDRLDRTYGNTFRPMRHLVDSPDEVPFP